MTTSRHTSAMTLLLAGGLLLLGGCDNRDEPAPPPEEQSAAPAARDMEPTPAPQPDTAAESPGMQEQASPQSAGGMAQSPAGAQSPADGADVETAMNNAGCFACHEVEQKKIGPPYAWVAHRYQDDENAVETLANSIKNGASGKWAKYTGGIPMPPNLQLADEQIREIAQWILEREPQEPPAS